MESASVHSLGYVSARHKQLFERSDLHPLDDTARKLVESVSEFTSRALDRWADDCGVDLKLIAAGKPTQNAYIESFNGKFRDECLNDHYFNTLHHARVVIAAWRRDYNETRPHSGIGRMPPAEFAARHRRRSNHGAELTIV